MEVFSHLAPYGHEQVVFAHDAETGLRAIIAVHSTALGPALGGTRIWNYATEAEALNDVLRLSHGMTLKNAAAGLPLGGGKAVIIGDAATIKTPALLRAYANFINSLGGRFYTAEDVNTSTTDIDQMKEHTQYVVGTSAISSDPSPFTARGVVNGIRAGLAATHGTGNLQGQTVAVQGLGNVGMNLCQLLYEAGATLLVHDLDPARVDEAARRFNAKPTSDILYAECDILAPCAMGAVITAENAPRLQCRMVAGSANNILATPQTGDMLHQRGITYLPDYIINAGGVINCAAEMLGNYDEGFILRQVDAIYDTVTQILAESSKAGIAPSRAADEYAQQVIRQKKQ